MAQAEKKDTHTLDKKLISPFIYATKLVMETMASTKLAIQAPVAYRKPFPCGDVSGMMPMCAEQVSGQLTLSFTNNALLSLASNMLQEQFVEINKDVVDVAGEITNIVTGAAKMKLSEIGYDFDMAQPTTYLSADYNNITLVGNPRIVIPCFTGTDNIFIDLGFNALDLTTAK